MHVFTECTTQNNKEHEAFKGWYNVDDKGIKVLASL